MIYFDADKNAYGFKIENPIATIDDVTWQQYAMTDKWDIIDGVFTDITDTEEYKEKETELRKANFEDNFLATPLGNYRLQPKGYANAQQSIDTVNAMVNVLGGLTEQIAQMVIFYATPDFTKEEECTEEWLVQHQSHPQPMTLQEWAQFYVTFSTLYAQKMYKKELENG